MRIAVFSTRAYDRRFLDEANDAARPRTALLRRPARPRHGRRSRTGSRRVCVFVNDVVDAEVIAGLAAGGTRLLTLRSAGFNHVDLDAAEEHGITVARVPAYSPYAVAEHTVALMLSVQRKIHRAHNRVRDGNFALDGLLGFDLRNKRIGIIGTGKIGMIVARIMRGFGCSIRAYDPFPSDDVKRPRGPLRGPRHPARRVRRHHAALPADARNPPLIDDEALRKTKPGVMIVNTSPRGAGRHAGGHRGAQGRARRPPRPRRVRGGGRPVLRGPVGHRDPRRRVLASAHLPERAGHRAPGLLHRGGAAQHRQTTLGNATAFAEGRDSGNEVRAERRPRLSTEDTMDDLHRPRRARRHVAGPPRRPPVRAQIVGRGDGQQRLRGRLRPHGRRAARRRRRPRRAPARGTRGLHARRGRADPRPLGPRPGLGRHPRRRRHRGVGSPWRRRAVPPGRRPGARRTANASWSATSRSR